ncbi:6-phosphogluconate dehydrogenase (decarboxylating) [Roseibium hamelinense]|uniref:6-phosphogluconate dehydrogenase, decarboxylating n=1 Tax=Roseibium hamelinense TaxID=150831 RepID=A0A562TGC5_9HYPH|nr:NADP-dependent phosphogluconate dehydrogenase [Roseibium hamelinense]TWI92647.1 6-phosphogluconate dehydrogenase (decarboxylating) [Roseibium hamelinense]
MQHEQKSFYHDSGSRDRGNDIGIIGLGTMGGSLALNIAEKGFLVSIWDQNPDKAMSVYASAGAMRKSLHPVQTLSNFILSLRSPRTVLLMVPAGEPVDAVLRLLQPHLDVGDIVIDAGNSNFHDTNCRAETLDAIGLRYMGVGVSGGEAGARRGPAIMAGGDLDAWEHVKPIFEAIAARYGALPCAAHVGNDGAGHLVKAVHNGIEYADMQLIAEASGLLTRGLKLGYRASGAVFEDWNNGPLQSYLIEITSKIFKETDPETGKPLLDVILDCAEQKGTGRWTAIEALNLGVPAGVISAAVDFRFLSARPAERKDGQFVFSGSGAQLCAEDLSIADIEAALIAGKIISYTQGFQLIQEAADDNGWDIDLASVARIWRNGCIIRSAMLDEMASALAGAPGKSLMRSAYFAQQLSQTIPNLRKVARAGIQAGQPIPALMAALAYFDTARTSRCTANVIQAQRDYFGAHGFMRTDQPGTGFRGPWAHEKTRVLATA